MYTVRADCLTRQNLGFLFSEHSAENDIFVGCSGRVDIDTKTQQRTNLTKINFKNCLNFETPNVGRR